MAQTENFGGVRHMHQSVLGWLSKFMSPLVSLSKVCSDSTYLDITGSPGALGLDNKLQ